MNVQPTYEFFDENGIVALRADKGISETVDQIEQLLIDLGNPTRAIPFYAFYPADGGQPVVVDGLISSQQVRETFEKLLEKSGNSQSTSTSEKSSGRLAVR